MPRPLSRAQLNIATILKFTALCGCFLALFHWAHAELTFGPDAAWGELFVLGIAALNALIFMTPRHRRTSPRCRSCGGSCLPTWNAEGAFCPRCRIGKLPPRQRRHAEYMALLAVMVLLGMLSVVVLFPISILFERHLDPMAYPILATILFVLLFGTYFVTAVARQLIASRRMARPEHALKVAQECAGETGKESSFGTVTLHVFGSNNPATMLKGQMDLTRGRMEALVGEPLEDERPLRVFVFGRRSAFDAFFRRVYLYGTNLDGVCISWATPALAITTEYPPYRLADPERIARMLMGYFHLDFYKKVPSPIWLMVGVANHLACGGNEEELARLNRRVLAPLSKGTALGFAEIFHPYPRALIRAARDWQEHANFTRYTLFAAQSWSVVEYLCGHDAPDDQRERFVGFLKEVNGNTVHEAVFLRHFGHGYDTLFQHWREWVLSRGAGTHAAQPVHVQAMLRESVLPIIRDGAAPPFDRIQAVRELGRIGYALGAETLIGLLEDGDPIPSAELVWSLEAISGLPLGLDTPRWRAWFEQLPEECAGPTDLARYS